MITALRERPEQFEFTSGSLHHFPSRHRFEFDEGRVRVSAACDCAFLIIEHRQEGALNEAFQQWRMNYWRPIEINRQFAQEQNQRSIRGLAILAAANLLAWLLRQKQVPALVPAPVHGR